MEGFLSDMNGMGGGSDQTAARGRSAQTSCDFSQFSSSQL